MKNVGSKKPDNAIPAELNITYDRMMEVYPMWLLWRATDRRFLPTELRKQPQDLLNDIIYIDLLMEKIVGQQLEKMDK